jgi:glycosyltransferase involved in cell wall biosynthesis
MMKRVNFVIAGNQFLKSQVIPYNPNVEVIPTSIDLSQYSVKKGYHPQGPITIGWLGSSSTLKYLRPLLPTLEKMFNGYPHFQLKIVCDQFLDSSYLPIIKKRWSSEEEEGDLKSFDIGIMPLSDDLWSRGKCGLKIVQYFGVGIPAVCTPVGMNRDIVENGVNGFWAQREEEWMSSLLKLMQDEELRKKMGRIGRKRVEEAYCLEVNTRRILDVLRKVSAS